MKTVGFIVNSRVPEWKALRRGMRPHHMLTGWPDTGSPMYFMRYRWIAREVNRGGELRYELFKPWRDYDAVVFLKSMEAGCAALAERLRARGVRVIFEANVDYYTLEGNRELPAELVPTPTQRDAAIKMTRLADRVIASSTHLANICAEWNERAACVPDNIPAGIIPGGPGGEGLRDGKLQLWWSGMPAKTGDLLAVSNALLRLPGRVHLNLVTGDLAGALDRLPASTARGLRDLLANTPHTLHRFRSIPDLLRLYHAAGGVLISPRFLDNPYNQSHTEWKITLGLACGLPVVASPQPSYHEVAARCGGPGTVAICGGMEEWCAAIGRHLGGTASCAAAARDVVERYYVSSVVAGLHRHELMAALGRS